LNRFRHQRIHGRRLRVAAVIFAAIGVLLAGISASEEIDRFSMARFATEQHGRPPAPTYWTRRDFARPGLTVKDLEEMEDTPGADRIVAAKLIATLDAIPSRGGAPPPGVYLSIAADHEAMYCHADMATFNEAYPFVTVADVQYFRRGDLGAMDLLALPRGVHFEYRYGYLTITLSGGDANRSTKRIGVDVMSTAFVVVALWLLWLAAHGTCAVTHRLIVQRRRRTGRCAGCGYILRATR
jgi:hypothetical protein